MMRQVERGHRPAPGGPCATRNHAATGVPESSATRHQVHDPLLQRSALSLYAQRCAPCPKPTASAALRQLSDDDLVRLRTAADSSPDVVPGLRAYLDYAGDREQHRRRGVDLAVQGPMAE